MLISVLRPAYFPLKKNRKGARNIVFYPCDRYHTTLPMQVRRVSITRNIRREEYEPDLSLSPFFSAALSFCFFSPSLSPAHAFSLARSRDSNNVSRLCEVCQGPPHSAIPFSKLKVKSNSLCLLYAERPVTVIYIFVVPPRNCRIRSEGGRGDVNAITRTDL